MHNLLEFDEWTETAIEESILHKKGYSSKQLLYRVSSCLYYQNLWKNYSEEAQFY